MKKLSESAWGEMRHRSAGKQIRNEDDPKYFTPDDFIEYIKNHYELVKKDELAQDIALYDGGNRIIVPIIETPKGVYGHLDHKLSIYIDYRKNGDGIFIFGEADKYKDILINAGIELRRDGDVYTISLDEDKTRNEMFLICLDLLIEGIPSEERTIRKKMYESAWGEMRKRSAGQQIRREDDINHLDVDGLYDYIKSKYEKRVFYLDKDTFGILNKRNIVVDIISNVSLFTSYDKSGKFDHILLSWSKVKISMPFFDKLKERFNVQIPNVNRRTITEKDGTCTNQTYIDVINFFLENMDNMIVNESAWGEMRRRSSGQQIRKEDEINLLDGEGLYEYIKEHYNIHPEAYIDYDDSLDNLAVPLFAYNTSTKFNEQTIYYGILDTVIYVSGNELHPEFKKILEDNYNLVKDEDEQFEDYFYNIQPKDNSKINNTLFISIIDYVLEQIKNISVVPLMRKKDKVNESAWGDMRRRSSGDIVRKEDDLTPDDVKYHIEEFVSRIVYYEQYENTVNDYERFSKERWRFFDDKGRAYTEKQVDYVKRNWEKGAKFRFVIENLIKEEEEKIKKLGFEKEPGKSVDETLDDWWDSVDDKRDFMDDCDEECYTNPDDMWADRDWEEKIKMYVGNKKYMGESAWGDMRHRSAGKLIRKEDDVLTDMEINSLNQFTLMYCRRERAHYIMNKIVPPPPSKRKENDYEGLIKYIEDRRDENLFTNVGDYNKIIKYIKKNWDRLDMDTYIKKWICSPDVMKGKKIVECEGVPGGATPANVGGMGAAYFPGPNGEPGSGDLPSPTGIVYQQVAPYTTFLKQIKKKKKKTKKFRKEDEPCVHSPNAKVYDYVDDFREYADRTYNNMDKRK